MSTFNSHNVVELFEEQVRRRPDATAVIFGEQQRTYRELNEQANRLAHYLVSRGVRRGGLVGVCLRRSIEMMAALIAVLKAGGAYVPLDPDYPRERLAFMLHDTGVALIITDSSCAKSLPSHPGEEVHLDRSSSAIERESRENPGVVIAPDDLIYIMYTSGSTGQPKGVMIEHRGVVRLVKEADYANFDSTERFLQMAPISFDASTLEVWGPLLNGGCLVVMGSAPPSLDEIGDTIVRHEVTSVWLPAGLFNLMIDQHPAGLSSLRQLISGGDAGSVAHFRKALETLPGVRLINGYGPTEATTFAVCLTVRNEHLTGSYVPIGKPINGTDVWLLDPQMKPVPSGEPGEIYIGGPGLARGYLNCPELTAERFIIPPWPGTQAPRLYRTGDLARWRNDGILEFLGRLDNQVKISGFRVEPGEVAAALRQHPAIDDVVVVAEQEPDGRKQLIAYFVPAGGRDAGGAELREFVQAKLPQFMVPAEFVAVNHIPLTHNGKVDRSALPRRARDSIGVTPIAADGSLSETIAGIWGQILHLDEVPHDANFFDLGGDSLKLISVHSKLQNTTGRKFPITCLFEYPTVAALAERLSSNSAVLEEPGYVQGRVQRQREMLTRRSHPAE